MKTLLRLLFFVLAASLARAALSFAIVWEARTDGSATNGGGFNSAASGTDWSRQAAAQYAVTDAVTAGTTEITSATANFGTDVVGNLLYIAGGTGAITGAWYEITARNSATSITVDRSTGLTTGTGATLNIGGALTLPGLFTAMNAHAEAGNVAYIKAGTHTITSTLNVTINKSGTIPYIVKFIGYDTNRSETNTDTKPIITTATNSVSLFTFNGANGPRFYNLKLTNSATTKGYGILNVTATSYSIWWVRCTFGDPTNKLISAHYTAASAVLSIANLRFWDCEIAYCTGPGIQVATGNTGEYVRCYIHDNASDGILATAQNAWLTVTSCVIANNGGYGVLLSRGSSSGQSLWASNNTFYNNTAGAFRVTYTTGSGIGVSVLTNNIFYGIGANTNISVQAANVGQASWVMWNNAFGGSGAFSNQNVQDGDNAVTLSGDPFVDSANKDFRLKADGAGLQCRGAGLAGPLFNTRAPDLGALQTLKPTVAY